MPRWYRLAHTFLRLARLTAKQANIHFTRGLAKRGVTSFAVHPGTIMTTSAAQALPEDLLVVLRARLVTLGIVEKTVQQGSSTNVVAALDPALKEHSGAYMADCQVAETTGDAVNYEGAVEALWELSEKLSGERFEI